MWCSFYLFPAGLWAKRASFMTMKTFPSKNLSLRLWFHFKRPFYTIDLFGESSLTLDTIRSSAPELESEMTQTSDTTKVKVWIKFISAGNVSLKENQPNQIETNLWSCHTIQLALRGFKGSHEIDKHPIIMIWSQLPNSMWGQLL